MANDIPIELYEAAIRTAFMNKFTVKPEIIGKIENSLVAGDSVQLKQSRYAISYDFPLPELRVGGKKYDRIEYGEVDYTLYPYQKGIKLTQEEVKFTEYSLPESLMAQAAKIGTGFNMLTQMMIEDLLLNAGGAATTLNWSVPLCYDGYELFSTSHRGTNGNIITASSGTSFDENDLLADFEEVLDRARVLPLKRNTDRTFFGGLSDYKLTILCPAGKATKFERLLNQTLIPIYAYDATANQSYAYGTNKDNAWKQRIDVIPMGKLTGNNYYVAISATIMPDIKPFMKLKWKSDKDEPEFVSFMRETSESAYEGDYYKMSWEKWFAVIPYFWECIYKVVKT